MPIQIIPNDEKDAIIKAQYYGRNGFRSPQGTYQDVRDKGITYAYVRDWYKRNLDRKRPTGGGKNSFVAQRPLQEFQADAFYMTPSMLPNQKYKYGISVIDIFSKRAMIHPTNSKEVAEWMTAFLKSFKELGGQPDMVMTDKDGTLMFGRGQMDREFEKMGIQYIQTAAAPHFVERFHRTFRGMLQKRVDKMREDEEAGVKKRLRGKQSETPQWHELMVPILEQYNKRIIHSATGMTPMEASKQTNQMDAKASMEIRAMKGRKYPPLAVGDKVRVLRRKTLGEKEAVGNFMAGTYEVVEISENLGQKFYRLDNGIEYIRSDIVKIDR